MNANITADLPATPALDGHLLLSYAQSLHARADQAHNPADAALLREEASKATAHVLLRTRRNGDLHNPKVAGPYSRRMTVWYDLQSLITYGRYDDAQALLDDPAHDNWVRYLRAYLRAALDYAADLNAQ